MGKEGILINKAGRRHGMKVPDGYFEGFAQNMMAQLPEYPETPKMPVLTRWQRIKPYIYMAAMFAGIWCMMKMFHIASQNAQSATDVVPEPVVLALQEPAGQEYMEFIAMDDGDKSDFELENLVSEQYDSLEEFEADFGYELRPEYQNLI